MEYPPCLKCDKGLMLPLSDYGRDGAAILLEILAKRPDPTSLPAVNAFLMATRAHEVVGFLACKLDGFIRRGGGSRSWGRRFVSRSLFAGSNNNQCGQQ